MIASKVKRLKVGMIEQKDGWYVVLTPLDKDGELAEEKLFKGPFPSQDRARWEFVHNIEPELDRLFPHSLKVSHGPDEKNH